MVVILKFFQQSLKLKGTLKEEDDEGLRSMAREMAQALKDN